MPKSSYGPRAFCVICPDIPTFTATIKGRPRWALERLVRAGREGLTSMTDPAARWAAYVHRLRGAGVLIETLHEAHGGPFAGSHARYRLACKVEAVA